MFNVCYEMQENGGEMYELIIPGLMITVCSVIDIREKSLPVWLPVVGGVAGGAVSIATGSLEPLQSVAGIGLGLALLFFSLLSKGGIGPGDAMVFAAAGAAIGIWRVLFLMWISFMAAGLAGLVILVILKKGRHYEIPFVPFLALAYGVMICMEVAG